MYFFFFTLIDQHRLFDFAIETDQQVENDDGINFRIKNEE